jgi:RNA polymerase sigma-70 factor, ECF subfamily
VNGSHDPPEIEELYASQAAGLVLQLFAYTGDLGTAQDVVQEAFCRAFMRWERVRRYDDPVAWLRRVAWNLAISRWRRLRRTASGDLPEVAVAGPSPDRIALVAALRQLPATHRRALVMHYIGDLATGDIAVYEGVAESTVRVWLHRGRATLAGLLAETGSERPHV